MKDWKNLLRGSAWREIDKIPPGWKTTVQLAKEMKLNRSYVCTKMLELKEKKLVETQEFVVKQTCGCRKVMHYKIL